jgi:cobalt transporter subunit CbtA
MAFFTRLFMCALLVGLGAGLAQSVVQRWQVVPIIEAAEAFESAGEPAAAAEHPHAAGEAHEHHANAWAPADGFERTFWTVVANVLTATGFALLMIPAIAWWNHRRGGNSATWRAGLVWGAAGWLCLFLWPALGLHPGIPGEASSLQSLRQGWWVLAAACAAGGVATLVFVRGTTRVVGLVMLALPFIIGAPMYSGPEFAEATAEAAAQLAALKADFFVATTVASAIQWIVIGVLAALVVDRWIRPLMDSTGAALPAGAAQSS